MRKTKIICTLGPSTDDPHILRELIENGMNTARLNFSHGSHEEHKKRVDMVKKLREELNAPVALLLDTKGPEVRTGTFSEGFVDLRAGGRFTLTADDVEGSGEKVSVSYKDLPRDVSVGTRVLIDDGLVELIVREINGNDIICEVMNNGRISDRKSVNFPGTTLNMPFISEKDRNDILFGIKNDFDYIAASFTYCARNVMDIRAILEENGGNDIHIIAKIENGEGVKNIKEIINAADGIMVARGDMGVEIDFERLPEIQKRIIDLCLHAGKKVITATQMLESMTHNPRPTRAEVSDVANAVYDGTSAVMLSGETAAGKYPVESLKVMAGTAEIAENDANYLKLNKDRHVDCDSSITSAISHATCTTASDLGAKAIIAVSWTGYTARMISCYRPMIQIIGVTINRKVWRQLALSWGVYPVMTDKKETHIVEMFEHSVKKALETGLVKTGDAIVITGGSPMGMGGKTNILKCAVCP